MSAKGENSLVSIAPQERWLIGLLALTALVYSVFWISPESAEWVYGDFCYPIMRWIQFYLFTFYPLPGYWVVWPVLAVGLIVLLFVDIRKKAPGRKVFVISKRILFYLGIWLSVFYWIWGFNYLRPGFLERSGFELEPVESEQVFKMLEETVIRLNELADLRTDWTTVDYSDLNRALRKRLDSYGYITRVPIQLINLPPKGILMRWSSAGIFMPFTGESNVDAAVLPVQAPFTSSHELAHAYGVTDEGVCNFLALITCLDSEYPYYNYSGWLSFYRYVAWEARKMDPERYKAIRRSLDQSVIDDLIAISENSKKYPDFFPRWKDSVYDRYLKSQGVKKGTESYNEIVMLKAAYDQSLKDR